VINQWLPGPKGVDRFDDDFSQTLQSVFGQFFNRWPVFQPLCPVFQPLKEITMLATSVFIVHRSLFSLLFILCFSLAFASSLPSSITSWGVWSDCLLKGFVPSPAISQPILPNERLTSLSRSKCYSVSTELFSLF
jgi:hypothetical protein